MLILRVSGSISNYGNTSDLQGKIATNAGVDASLVSITVEAGSVILTAKIEVPASTNATAVRNSLRSILGNTTLASNALGIQVESVESVHITRIPAPSDISVWLPVSFSFVGCCFCSLLMLAFARRRRSSRLAKRIPGSGGGDGANRVRSAAQQRELMAAAAVALRSARDIVATSRDDTPSPLPVLQRFASTIQRRGLDLNGLHFATTQHEPAGQERPPATFACRPDGSYLPPTDSQVPPTNSDLPAFRPVGPSAHRATPTARVQALEWLSDAIDHIPPTRDSTPANPVMVPYGYSRGALPPMDSRPPHVMRPMMSRMRSAMSSSAMSSRPTERTSSSDFEAVAPAGAAPPPVPSERPPQDIEMTSPQQLPQESLPSEFGVNSEFHPMSSATVEQSSSDQTQGGAPNGMMIVPQPHRKSKRTFPSLGFRLVWNDAPNADQQDATVIYRKYEKVKTLGKGSFGTAVLLRHRRTGHLVVSKQVRVQEMPRVELSKVERRTNQP